MYTFNAGVDQHFSQRIYHILNLMNAIGMDTLACIARVWVVRGLQPGGREKIATLIIRMYSKCKLTLNYLWKLFAAHKKDKKFVRLFFRSLWPTQKYKQQLKNIGKICFISAIWFHFCSTIKQVTSQFLWHFPLQTNDGLQWQFALRCQCLCVCMRMTFTGLQNKIRCWILCKIKCMSIAC